MSSGSILKFFESKNTIAVTTTSNSLLLNLCKDVEVICKEVIDIMAKLPRRMDVLS